MVSSFSHPLRSSFITFAFLCIESSEEDHELFHCRVNPKYTANLPRNLLIPSCNLHLNEPVGQGMNTITIITVLANFNPCRGVWYCLQSTAV